MVRRWSVAANRITATQWISESQNTPSNIIPDHPIRACRQHTPAENIVAFYRVREITCSSGMSKISGRWFITFTAACPQCRGLCVLDSQIPENWPWERYLAEGSVAGVVNSSQPFACKDPRCNGDGNPFDANCDEADADRRLPGLERREPLAQLCSAAAAAAAVPTSAVPAAHTPATGRVRQGLRR